MAMLRQMQTGGRLSIPKGMLRAIGVKEGDSVLLEYIVKDHQPVVVISAWKGSDYASEPTGGQSTPERET